MAERQGRPKVSVCVITYNHAAYIAQCLQSILDQQTSFEFEVVVGDDASRDGTRDIVLDFQARCPGKLRALAHERNIGGVRNYLAVHAAARGEYIAHVDGDDYVLPGKLEAQAAWLDAEPDCMVVWHRMKVLDMRTGQLLDDLVDPAWVNRRRFTRAEMLALGTIGFHSSKMYRAAHRDFPLPPFDILDFLATVEHIDGGYACFVGNGPLGVYRSGIGLGSAVGTLSRLNAQTLEYLAKRFPEHRASINALALRDLLAGLKNGRASTLGYLTRAWLRTFHPKSPMLLARSLREMRHLRVPQPRHHEGEQPAS